MPNYSDEQLAITLTLLRLVSKEDRSLKQACEALCEVYSQRGMNFTVNLSWSGEEEIKAIYMRIIGTAFPSLSHEQIKSLNDEQYFSLSKTCATVGLDERIVFCKRPYTDLQLFLGIYLNSKNNGRYNVHYLAPHYRRYGLSDEQYTIAMQKFRELLTPADLIISANFVLENFDAFIKKYAFTFNRIMRTQFSITLKDLSLVELYRVLHTPNQQVSSFAQEMKISVSDLNTYIRFHTDLTTEQFLQAQVDEISEQMLIRHAVSGYRKNLNLEPKQIFTPVYFSLRDFLEQCLDKKTPYTLTYLQIYVIAKALEMRIINPGISINIDSLGLIVDKAYTCTLETLKDPFTHISSKATTHRERFIHYYDKDFIEIAKEFLSGISVFNPIASPTLSTVDKADKRNNLSVIPKLAENTVTVRSTYDLDKRDDDFIFNQSNFYAFSIDEPDNEPIFSLQVLDSRNIEPNSEYEMSEQNEGVEIANLAPTKIAGAKEHTIVNLPLVKILTTNKQDRFFGTPNSSYVNQGLKKSSNNTEQHIFEKDELSLTHNPINLTRK